MSTKRPARLAPAPSMFTKMEMERKANHATVTKAWKVNGIDAAWFDNQILADATNGPVGIAVTVRRLAKAVINITDKANPHIDRHTIWSVTDDLIAGRVQASVARLVKKGRITRTTRIEWDANPGRDAWGASLFGGSRCPLKRRRAYINVVS